MMRRLVAVLALIGLDRLISPRRRASDRAGALLRRGLWTLAALAPVVAIGSVLLVLSGIVPIAASSGHWAITRRILDFAKVRSVSTYALGIEAPRLDDPLLVLKGAAHYERGCQACHGSPLAPPPRIPQFMTPAAPDLGPRIARWKPEELFYIVKHGIKFTGMPAWPALRRDDEVWAMVAFLRIMPGLEPREYVRLAFGNAPVPVASGLAHFGHSVHAAPGIVSAVCARCHGSEGTGRGVGAFPRLAGQRADYLRLSLEAFARTRRHSGIMGPIAASLGGEAIGELARYYNDVPPAATGRTPLNPAAVQRGAAIATYGIPAQDVPSCADCHGPGAKPRNPAYPVLAGQYPEYLRLQLELFKTRRRGGTEFAHLMHEVVDHLTPEQMQDAALYYASLSAPERE